MEAHDSPSENAELRVGCAPRVIIFIASQFAEIAENGSDERSKHVKRFWLLALLTQFLAAGAFAELVTYKLSTPGVV